MDSQTDNITMKLEEKLQEDENEEKSRNESTEKKKCILINWIEYNAVVANFITFYFSGVRHIDDDSTNLPQHTYVYFTNRC